MDLVTRPGIRFELAFAGPPRGGGPTSRRSRNLPLYARVVSCAGGQRRFKRRKTCESRLCAVTHHGVVQNVHKAEALTEQGEFRCKSHFLLIKKHRTVEESLRPATLSTNTPRTVTFPWPDLPNTSTLNSTAVKFFNTGPECLLTFEIGAA